MAKFLLERKVTDAPDTYGRPSAVITKKRKIDMDPKKETTNEEELKARTDQEGQNGQGETEETATGTQDPAGT